MTSVLPASIPTAVASTAAASTAIKGHAHHDQAILPRMDLPLKVAFLVIVSVMSLASFRLVPVYLHMMLVTVATVFIGSRFALKCWKIEAGTTGAKNEDAHGNEIHRAAGEQMQTKDAMMFPVIGSCVLFSLYCVYKFLPAEYVNFVIKLYFFIFGCLVLAQKFAQILTATLPCELVHRLLAREYSIPNPAYAIGKVETALLPVLKVIPGLGYNVAPDANAEVQPAADFWMPLSVLDLVALGLSLVVSTVYIATGSWACSNLFGIAFSIQGIEMLSLGSYLNGCILLSGLFIYDIFWVFGTDVMVTVAKSFDAPIKLLFPQFGVDSSPSMLGLGDIVIPGIFIALLLRYDIWRQIQRVRAHAKKTQAKAMTQQQEHELECLYCHMETRGSTLQPIYFVSNLVAYFVGLSVTVGVMYWFKAAQPALLYLVPACLGTSLVLAVVRGDMKTLWKYTENEDDAPTTTAAAAATKPTGAEAAAASSTTAAVDSSVELAEEETTTTTKKRSATESSSKKKRSARAD